MSRAIPAALVALTLTATPAHALTVPQGDGIIVGGTACTVGVNHNGLSYTAGHCSNAPARVSAISTSHPDESFPHVGMFYPAPDADFGYVRWNSAVELGPSRFAEPTFADASPGDTACVRGFASRTTACGEVVAVTARTIDYAASGTVLGDSGAPVWLSLHDDHPFLALHTARVATTSLDGTTTTVSRATRPDFSFRHPADNGTADRTTLAPGSSDGLMNFATAIAAVLAVAAALGMWFFLR